MKLSTGRSHHGRYRHGFPGNHGINSLTTFQNDGDSISNDKAPRLRNITSLSMYCTLIGQPGREDTRGVNPAGECNDPGRDSLLVWARARWPYHGERRAIESPGDDVRAPDPPVRIRGQGNRHRERKHVSLKVNDRGPYVKGRILDLSEGAARELGGSDRGLMAVRIEIVSIAKGLPPG